MLELYWIVFFYVPETETHQSRDHRSVLKSTRTVPYQTFHSTGPSLSGKELKVRSFVALRVGAILLFALPAVPRDGDADDTLSLGLLVRAVQNINIHMVVCVCVRENISYSSICMLDHMCLRFPICFICFLLWR